MDTRSSLTMRNLANALAEVIQWYELGIALGIKPFKLEEIRRNRMGEVQLCKLNLLDYWLRSDLDASWEQLAGALDDISHADAAQKIRQKYLGGIRRVAPDSCSPAMSMQQFPGGLGGVPFQQELTDAHQLMRSQEPDKLEKMVTGLSNMSFDINFTTSEQMNQTLLHNATTNGDIDSVKVLITFGANVNCKNTFGQTPFDLAKMQQHAEIAGLLKSVGGESGFTQNQGTEQRAVLPTSEPRSGYRLLSLDNSSKFAIIQVEVLSQIEQHTGKPVTAMFDWIVASGVGALLILAMVYGKKSMADLRRLYFKLRESVFAEPRVDYRSEALQRFVQELFGTELRMCDVQQPRLLIGAVNKASTRLELHLFNNCLEDEYSQVPVWKVARYTCTALMVIRESDNYTDGGAICTNLTDHALTRMRQFYRERGQEAPIGCMVSVGAGILSPEEIGSVDVEEYLSVGAASVNPREIVQRMRNAIALYSSAAFVLSEQMAKNCQSQCEAQNVSFFRFNPILEQGFSLLPILDVRSVIEIALQTSLQVMGKKLDELAQCLQVTRPPDPADVTMSDTAATLNFRH